MASASSGRPSGLPAYMMVALAIFSTRELAGRSNLSASG